MRGGIVTRSSLLRRVAQGSNSRRTINSASALSGDMILQPPYPTEGGSVPVYSMMHGLIDKRNWAFRNPEWCSLCNEPISRWVDHQSRKDHALLDTHYSQLAEWPRRWNPELVITTFREHLGIDSIESCHAVFNLEDGEGRTQLYAMLVKLEESGMLYFGETRDTYLCRMVGGLRGMDHQGALVLHDCLLGPFLHLFPNGLIQDFSNLLDFITCSYNMETVYDMCRMYTLDRIALKAQYGPSSPAAMGLGGIATSSSASRGFQNDLFASIAGSCGSATGEGSCSEGQISHSSDESLTGEESSLSLRQAQYRAAQAAKQQEKTEGEAFSRKSAFVRQVLGQLRWLMTPTQEHPAGFTFPEHVLTIGELCLKALVVAIIEARLCEYMVRAEPVWRNFGCERRRLDLRAIVIAATDVMPRLPRYSYLPATAPDGSDLYDGDPRKLDEKVREGLYRKKLPVPTAFTMHAKPKSNE